MIAVILQDGQDERWLFGVSLWLRYLILVLAGPAGEGAVYGDRWGFCDLISNTLVSVNRDT